MPPTGVDTNISGPFPIGRGELDTATNSQTGTGAAADILVTVNNHTLWVDLKTETVRHNIQTEISGVGAPGNAFLPSFIIDNVGVGEDYGAYWVYIS